MTIEGRFSVVETEWVNDPRLGLAGPRLALAGELDLSSAPALASAFGAVLRHWPALVVLDLERLEGMDADGAATIEDARKRIDGWGGVLEIRRPQRTALRVLERCGLGHLLAPSPAAH